MSMKDRVTVAIPIKAYNVLKQQAWENHRTLPAQMEYLITGEITIKRMGRPPKNQGGVDKSQAV